MTDYRQLYAMAQACFADMVTLRRHFHTWPEMGPEEQVNTMARIMQELDRLEIPYVHVPYGGIIARIDGPADGRTVLLRADMDALPIQEDPQNLAGPRVCISQVPGVMHACGHDAHTAMLLAEARILKQLQPQLKGPVVLVFEEGEEGFPFIEQICRYLDSAQIHIDTCYAAHVRWDIPAGKITCFPGAAMSGQYHFSVRLFGKSGHGSRPDLAASPVDCFCQLYSVMQSLRMKTVRPDTSLTWSVGILQAGELFNVIPEELEFHGSIRFMDRESGEAFWNSFRQALDHVCTLCGCTYILRCLQHLLPVMNDPACTALCRQAVSRALGPDSLYDGAPWMASESYSYLCNMIPGVFAFVGIRNEALGAGANHHTPQFDLDESAMVQGVTAALAYTLAFQDSPPDTAAFVPVCGSMTELVDRLHDHQEGTALQQSSDA